METNRRGFCRADFRCFIPFWKRKKRLCSFSFAKKVVGPFGPATENCIPAGFPNGVANTEMRSPSIAARGLLCELFPRLQGMGHVPGASVNLLALFSLQRKEQTCFSSAEKAQRYNKEYTASTRRKSKVPMKQGTKCGET